LIPKHSFCNTVCACMVIQIKLVVGRCCRTVLRGWTVVDAVGWFRTFFDGV